jgi:hypothetical protein
LIDMQESAEAQQSLPMMNNQMNDNSGSSWSILSRCFSSLVILFFIMI